jgi:hypothetical protein
MARRASWCHGRQPAARVATISGSGTASTHGLSDLPAPHMALSRALVASVLLHAAVVGAFTWAGAVRSAAALVAPASSVRPLGAVAGDTFDVDAISDAPRRGDQKLSTAAAGEKKPSQPAPAPKPEAGEPVQRARKASRAPAAKPIEKPSDAAQTSGASEQGDDERSYGAAGLPPGVRQLAPAFTQAIAAATNRDPYWAELPFGNHGSARVVIDVGEDGRITLVERDGAQTLPPPLERMLKRTLLLLRAGRFALSRRGSGAGRESFEIEVTLSQIPPPEGDWDDPGHTASIGFTPPKPGRPGRAYFVHGSGRRFDAKVTLAPTEAR